MNKQMAMDLLENTRKEFLAHMRWVAKRTFASQGNITIDDVRDQCPLPDGVKGTVYGAVFNTEDWEKVGYTYTRRETSHGRPIAIWRYIGPRVYQRPANLPIYEPRQMGLL